MRNKNIIRLRITLVLFFSIMLTNISGFELISGYEEMDHTHFCTSPILRSPIPDDLWEEYAEFGCPNCGQTTLDQITGKCSNCGYTYEEDGTAVGGDNSVPIKDSWGILLFCTLLYIAWRCWKNTRKCEECGK